jgi:hypothetical protein
MKKLKAEITKWNGNLYSVYMQIRSGNLETGNHKSESAAKRAFVAMCNRVGIDRNIYEFDYK